MRVGRQHFARSCSAALTLALAFGPVVVPRLSSLGSQPTPHVTGEVVRHPTDEKVVAKASVRPRPKMTRVAAEVAPVADRGDVFRGLGAWVDLYDFTLDPVRTVGVMKANGVQTLYIQTGRTDTAYMVDPRVWNWVRAAHRANIKVVGWYLPWYAKLSRDYMRSIAIARTGPGELQFDGLGIDIEFRQKVGRRQWMQRVAELEAAVRRHLPNYPIAAIVPPPLQMTVAPGHWAGFPWAALAKSSDAFLLMSYWSDRAGCPQISRFCAFGFTANNVAITRKLAQRPGVLVHVVGGVGGSITIDQARDFVRGALVAHADGASLYDVNTTTRFVWPVLRTLSGIGTKRR